MIIAISGYIGSGKDTVGSIIQYLTYEHPYQYVQEPFKNWIEHYTPEGRLLGSDMLVPHPWKIKKFAGKLKQIASILTGIPVEKFEDQEFKKSYLGPEWDYYPIIGYNFDEPIYGKEKVPMTVRELLQKLGTEAIRDNLHQNAWVNATLADYHCPHCGWADQEQADGCHKGKLHHLPNWIITDIRFPNEAEAVKARGGLVIRVNRFKSAENTKEGMYLHPSETSLDDWDFDYFIDNNGSLDELVQKVDSFLKQFNLL